jgi:hypothetical protein
MASLVHAAPANPLAFALLCALLALSVFGCSSGAGVTSAAGRTPAGLSHAHTLVWATTAEDAPPSTYALADDGTILSRRDGVRISAAGTEWKCEVTVERVATSPCEGGPQQAAQEGRGVRVRLVPQDTSKAPLEIVRPFPGDQANDVQQAARLLASVGPYLFLEESTYTYTCGAHGNTGVSFAVWDLDEGRSVDMLSDLPDREHILAAGKSAIDARPDAIDFSRPSDPPALTELLPRIGQHGQLEATALVTVASCYACTEGGWSSYTVSTQVPVTLPWRLRGVGAPPRAVGAFVDGHPDLTVGGYSVSR